MACTIAFDLPLSGLGGLTLELYPLAAGGIANGAGGDAVTQPDAENRPYRYAAAVAEALAGDFRAVVKSGTAAISMGLVRVRDDGETYLIGDYDRAAWDVLEDLTEVHAGKHRLTEAAVANVDATLGAVHVESFLPTALAQLAGKTIIVSAPAIVANQLRPPIIRGDDYSAGLGTAITLSNGDWPELDEEAEVMLQAVNKRTGVSFEIPGTVVEPTGVKTIQFELSAVESLQLVAGVYQFEISVTMPAPGNETFTLIAQEDEDGRPRTLRVIDGL